MQESLTVKAILAGLRVVASVHDAAAVQAIFAHLAAAAPPLDAR